MRKYLLFLFIIAFGSLCCPAQQGEPTRNIVHSIMESTDSTVVIEIPQSLLRELTPAPKVEKPTTERRRDNREKLTGPRRVPGYRIQIFSDSRNQATLQSRARVRTSQVLARFPHYAHQVYTISKAPNLYTRIGNFATRAEANSALSELRRAFPAFSGELRVVNSDVIIGR